MLARTSAGIVSGLTAAQQRFGGRRLQWLIAGYDELADIVKAAWDDVVSSLSEPSRISIDVCASSEWSAGWQVEWLVSGLQVSFYWFEFGSRNVTLLSVFKSFHGFNDSIYVRCAAQLMYLPVLLGILTLFVTTAKLPWQVQLCNPSFLPSL